MVMQVVLSCLVQSPPLSLTPSTHYAQLIRDLEDVTAVNQQLEKM